MSERVGFGEMNDKGSCLPSCLDMVYCLVGSGWLPCRDKVCCLFGIYFAVLSKCAERYRRNYL